MLINQETIGTKVRHYFFRDPDLALADGLLPDDSEEVAPLIMSITEPEELLPLLEQDAGTGFTPTLMEAYVTPGTAFWARCSSGRFGLASLGIK